MKIFHKKFRMLWILHCKKKVASL